MSDLWQLFREKHGPRPGGRGAQARWEREWVEFQKLWEGRWADYQKHLETLSDGE